MRHRRSFSTAPSPRPSDGDLTLAVDYAHCIVDQAMETLILLSPDTSAWAVPAGAVDRACYADERYDRAQRRVREVQERLRKTTPARFHPDIDDLDDAVVRAMTEAAECGWRLGMTMARRSARVDA